MFECDGALVTPGESGDDLKLIYRRFFLYMSVHCTWFVPLGRLRRNEEGQKRFRLPWLSDKDKKRPHMPAMVITEPSQARQLTFTKAWKGTGRE